MRKLLLLLALSVTPLVSTSCQTAPSERVIQVQTLKAVGASAEAAVGLSAQLYRDKKITPAQARSVMDFYDQKFQPAFRLAVSAARSDLSTVASPDLVALASELSALVLKLQTP